MRLEFESNSSALPVTEVTSENELVENGSGAAKELLREGIKAAQAGNRSEARHLLLRVTELESANENAWLWLASISEYPEELLVFLKNVLEINPDNQRAIEWTKATRSLLAKTFVQRGIDAAREDQKVFANQCFNHAIAQDENNETAWIWMASVSDSDEEKIGFLEKALSIDPENPETLAGLTSISETRLESAYTAAAQGDSARANELLDLVLERIPESEDAWLLRSDLVEDKAAKTSILEKVLTINPGNEEAAAALRSVGREILGEQFRAAGEAASAGDYFLANSLLEDVLAKSPEMEEAWILKSELAGDRSEKISILDKVLSINPENERAQEALTAIGNEIIREQLQAANAAAIGGNRDKALRLLDEVLAKSPEMEEAWVLKSHLAENFDDKIKAFEKVLEINPGNPAAQAGLESLNAIMRSVPPETAEEAAESSPVQHQFDEEEVAEHRSPTQELVFPEAMAEENPFGDAPSPFEDEPSVEMESEPESELSEESLSEEEQPSLAADPWPTEESLPEVSESVEELYGNSGPEEEYRPESSDFENEEDFLGSAESAAFDEGPSFDEESTYNEVEEPEEASIHDTDVAFNVGESPFADCPYCRAKNDSQAYQCDSCSAILTLSDLEMLLAHQNADKQILGFAVERMEAEREQRAFNEDELKALGIAYINLKNFPWGLDCLQEAQRLNPNDVLLSGQVNALSIRFAEIREQEEAHEALPKGKTILVVDDSATVRKLIAGKLEKSGHEVICAVDGVDALEKIEEIVPDLILLDINMPRMDGYQVCKLIRNNHATENVPVVMISGKDGFFDKVRGRMSGTTGYITKPFGPETLMKALETYIVNDVEPVTAEQ
jgi:twitching motility two-component system response regulator PilG